MNDEPTEFPPTQYSWLRTRQLEGTFPGPGELGTWDTNYLRVRKFLGYVEEPIWTGDWPPDVDPSSWDGRPDLQKTSVYRRLYSFDDCREALRERATVSCTFYVTQKWKDCPEGKLVPRKPTDEILGTHTVGILPPIGQFPHPVDWSPEDFLVARNSWGYDWGIFGFAAVSKELFEKDCFAAWALYDPDGSEPEVTGSERYFIDSFCRSGNRNSTRMIEYRSGANQKLGGWLIYNVQAGQVLVDDLYVVPDERGKGIGKALISRLRRFLVSRQCPPARVSFWIPFSDVEDDTKHEFLESWLAESGLILHNSQYNFAAYVATPVPRSSKLQRVVIPSKPSFFFPVAEFSQPVGIAEDVREIQRKYEVTDSFAESASAVFATRENLLRRLAR